MRIFKYIDHHGLDVVRDRRLKVSLAQKLNDPFELSPRIAPTDYTLRSLARLLRQDHLVRNAYAKEGQQRGLSSFKRFKRVYLRDLPKRAEKLMVQLPNNVETLRARFAQFFSKRFRLLCCSKRKDSILMWSHYAKNHEGMVIEFDTCETPLSQLLRGHICEVTYSDMKPEFILVRSPVDFQVMLLNVAKTKSLAWSYEAEVRLLLPESRCVAREFFPFTEKAVKSVTFGCRCADDLRNRTLAVLAQPDYKHVQLFQARLSKTAYQLEFHEFRIEEAKSARNANC